MSKLGQGKPDFQAWYENADDEERWEALVEDRKTKCIDEFLNKPLGDVLDGVDLDNIKPAELGSELHNAWRDARKNFTDSDDNENCYNNEGRWYDDAAQADEDEGLDDEDDDE